MTLKILAKDAKNRESKARMSLNKSRNLPWWLLPHAWGIDVAFAAFLWGGACATFQRSSLLGSGAMLLLAVAAWVCVMVSRVWRALVNPEAYYASFYRAHVSWLAPLVVCAICAALWMLFFYVGQGLLAYVPYVVLPLFLGVCFGNNLLACMMRALAFALACFAPSAYYSIAASPWLLFFSSQVWCIAGLFCLFCLHRAFLNRAESIRLVVHGFMVAFIWLLISIWNAPSGYKGFYCFMVMVLACLHILHWRVRRMGREVNDALDWPLMGLAAAAGAAIFAPGGMLIL